MSDRKDHDDENSDSSSDEEYVPEIEETSSESDSECENNLQPDDTLNALPTEDDIWKDFINSSEENNIKKPTEKTTTYKTYTFAGEQVVVKEIEEKPHNTGSLRSNKGLSGLPGTKRSSTDAGLSSLSELSKRSLLQAASNTITISTGNDASMLCSAADSATSTVSSAVSPSTSTTSGVASSSSAAVSVASIPATSIVSDIVPDDVQACANPVSKLEPAIKMRGAALGSVSKVGCVGLESVSIGSAARGSGLNTGAGLGLGETKIGGGRGAKAGAGLSLALRNLKSTVAGGGPAAKLTTLEKSKLDWTNFVNKNEIRHELAAHNKGKSGYLERKAFEDRVSEREYNYERENKLKPASSTRRL